MPLKNKPGLKWSWNCRSDVVFIEKFIHSQNVQQGRGRKSYTPQVLAKQLLSPLPLACLVQDLSFISLFGSALSIFFFCLMHVIRKVAIPTTLPKYQALRIFFLKK